MTCINSRHRWAGSRNYFEEYPARINLRTGAGCDAPERVQFFIPRRCADFQPGLEPPKTAASVNYNQGAKHPHASQNGNACASKTFSQTQQYAEFCWISSLRWSPYNGSVRKLWS